MKNGNSLDVEIESRLNSPRLIESFPTGSRTVAKCDTDVVRIHFADIAAGRITVK